jgi:thioredoxin reductase
MNEYDVAVIGGGAAGLSAALVLTRARRRVVVIDAGEPRNAPAAHMQGFLSRDGTAPARLLEEGRAEVAGYGAEIVAERVERIEAGFAVHLASGRTLHARRVLVTTGLRDELPDVPGLRDRWARDVLHCPYCHGYEVRDRPLGVLGTLHLGLLLPQWSADVVFFPHRTELSADERERLLARGVHIADGEVTGLAVDGDALRGVELADGRVVPREVLFVGPRFVPRDGLLAGLGCATGDDGWVRTDPTGRTSVPGVWAAGNVVDPRAQVVTAAGMGSAAAIALNADLVQEDVQRAVAEHRRTAEAVGAAGAAR